MTTDDRVQLQHPEAGKAAPRVQRAKYDLVRKALLAAIPAVEQGVRFAELAGLVERALTPEELGELGAVGWYTTAVKLDLEARGEIERVPGARPQRVRRGRVPRSSFSPHPAGTRLRVARHPSPYSRERGFGGNRKHLPYASTHWVALRAVRPIRAGAPACPASREPRSSVDSA